MVHLNKLNILEFVADFTGSENISLEGETGLVGTREIAPFECV
jgi:hypothetical protein